MLKYFVILIIAIPLFYSCTENISEPKAEKTFWTEPLEEGTILYFRLFDSERIDSLTSGEIQFRLNIAKTVIEDTTLNVREDWRLGDLIIATSDELYNAFDTTSTFRFNYSPLDSLLSHYELKSGEKLYSFLRLKFPEYYNMVILSQIFSKVDGVIWAEQNVIGGPGICVDDISLEIDNEIYKFIFSRTGSCGYYFWEVHVVDDSAEFIKEWEE